MLKWLLIANVCGLPAAWDCERMVAATFTDQSACVTIGLMMPIEAEFQCKVQVPEVVPLPRPRPAMLVPLPRPRPGQ